MEAARPLRAVDPDTGETFAGLEDLRGELEKERRQNMLLEHDLRGKRLQIDGLKRELANQQGQEPEAQDVRTVLDDWCRIALSSGWWSRLPRYKPADPRWKATKAAFHRDYDVPYLCTVNKGAFMAAAGRRQDSRFSRAWLEPKTIYGGGLEANFEHAMDPERQWVRAALEAPAALRARWLEVLDLAQPCDCTHIRLDHQKPALTVDDRLTFGECLVHGCHCEGFDYDWTRDERVRSWVEAQT